MLFFIACRVTIFAFFYYCLISVTVYFAALLAYLADLLLINPLIISYYYFVKLAIKFYDAFVEINISGAIKVPINDFTPEVFEKYLQE